MDSDLIIIFSFILTIVFTGLAFAMVMHRRVATHEERKLELKARIAEAQKGERAIGNDAMQHIEDRLRVIERIVTDPGADLSRQIEDLRAETNARQEQVQ